MKKQLVIILSIFCIVFLSLAVEGQTKKEILTNEKIIELVRLDLSEVVVIEKIRQSDCQCDTSTVGLAKLKAAKVSDGVIMAMMGMQSGKNTSSSVQTSKSPAQTEKNLVSETVVDASLSGKELEQLSEPGIYLYENGVMKTIEPAVFSGGKMNPLLGAVTYGIVKTKYRAKVRGKAANLQTLSSQPIFYFVFNPEIKNSGATMAGLFWGMPATSPNEFMLVQMSV